MDKKTDNKLSVQSKAQTVQKFSASSIMLAAGIITFAIGLFAIFITVYFFVAISFASEQCQFKIDNASLNIIFSIISLSVLYLFYKILPKINKYILLAISLAFTLILGLWWVNLIRFKPISDQSMVVYCGEKLAENDLPTILNPGEYLNRNPHQLGFSLYIMAIFRILSKNSVLTLQILNVIYSTVSGFVLYLICKEIFKEEIVQKICLLFITFFAVYLALFSVHVYGNIPGLMFGLIALLFTLKFLDNNKIYNLAISGVSIAIAYLLKSNYEIFACAIIIILALYFLQTYKKQAIAGAILVLFCMFTFKTYVYKHVENGTGYSLSSGVPMVAYIYMGIAEPVTLTPGWYTGDVELIYNESNFNKEEATKIASELLKNRLIFFSENLGYAWNFFTSKLQTTWLNPTFQAFWCSIPSTMMELDAEYNERITSNPIIENILCGDIQRGLERTMDIFQIITFLSAGFALFTLFRAGGLKETLLPLTFLGGFIFHIIWETKSIYVIQYFYILLPFSAYGIYMLFKCVDKKLNARFKNIDF